MSSLAIAVERAPAEAVGPSASPWVVAVLVAILSAGTHALADDAQTQQSAGERMWEEILRPSADTMADLDRGKVVTWFLEPDDGRDISFVGLARTTASAGRFVAVMDNVGGLRLHRPDMRAAGIAGRHPGWATANLFVDQEVRATQRCRPGKCDMKLPANVMEALRNTTEIEETRPVIERFIEATLARYREGGAQALPHINDKSEELVPGDVFRHLLAKPPLTAWPAVQAIFRDYPAPLPPGAREQFFWTREHFWRRDVTSLTHSVIASFPAEDRQLTVHVAMQLHANHYFEGVQVVTGLLREGDGTALLFVWHRIQIDLARRPLNTFERWFLSRRGRGRLENELGLLRARIERADASPD